MYRQRVRVFLVAATLILFSAVAASAAIEVLDAFYRPDRMLPQWNHFWPDGGSNKPGDVDPTYGASGMLCIYVKNTGGSSVTISDILLQSVSLVRAMGCRTEATYRSGLCYACSIHYPSSDPITSDERTTLINAGEPVWFRFDPSTIEAGGIGEIVIRMRTRVQATLSLSIVPTAGSNVDTSITVSNDEIPRVSAYALSSDSTKLYLYLRHMTKGKTPTQVLVDGTDVTANCTIGGDSDVDVVPVKCNLASAFVRGDVHCFKAVYNDSTSAVFGLRVYAEDFIYGRWGGPTTGLDTNELKAAAIRDMGRHSINIQVQGAASLGSYMETNPGQTVMVEQGIKRLHETIGKPQIWGLFLCDEPDTAEARVPTYVTPVYARSGVFGQSLSDKSKQYKVNHKDISSNLNVDATNRPYSWYQYGHCGDVLSSDPYYQITQGITARDRPNQLPWYAKATNIYAVGETMKAACEPRPVHLLLDSTRQQDGPGGKVFRWATPEEKRIEVFYSVAAGARQIAYWWYTPADPSGVGVAGCGNNEPGAQALWREIGLIGAELGTASPVLSQSNPAEFPITNSGKLWTRALVRGVDTVVVLCVNDDYANSDAGTVIHSVDNAEVSFDLPSWLGTLANVFEVDYKGITDTSYTVASGRITLDLGRVNVTRMVIITTDSNLKSTLQSLYSSKYGPRVDELIPH